MKKTSILLISLALVMLFASSAFAAQATFSVGTHTYATPTTVVSVTYGTYSQGGGYVGNHGITGRVYGATKFNADGTTNYPYEIYLPNETNPDQYRIHTNYSKSTDACASCHATHTAVGPSLLQWYTTYDTCIACHDGTVTTTYNVVQGKIASSNANPTFGGLFGDSSDLGHSLSNHNVTGAVTIASAPGGSVAAVAAPKGYNDSFEAWTPTFGCESCHTPHGQGGNARILSPDPNGYASLNQKYPKGTDYLSVTTKGQVYCSTNSSVYVPLITGYPYKVTIENNEYTDASNLFIVKNDGSVSGASYSYLVNAADGSPYSSGVGKIKATVAFQVRMNIQHYLGLDGSPEVVKHVSGINYFCGACHVDYNTETYVKTGANGIDKIMGSVYQDRPGYGKDAGEYSSAHRHAVGLKWNYGGAADKNYIGKDKALLTMGEVSGSPENGNSEGGTDGATYISCLTCHFAHGTSENFWLRWVNKYSLDVPYWSTGTNLHEISGSSALKRLPNMATCEACHQKGADATGYSTNSGTLPTSEANIVDGIFAPGGLSVSNVGCQDAAKICHQHEAKIAKFIADSSMKTKKCEDCHGLAGNHIIQPSAKNIVNPRNQSVADQTTKCLSCHDGFGATDDERGFLNSKHYSTDVISCNTCHDSHHMNTEVVPLPLKGERNALCATCHNTAELNIPGFLGRYHE